MEPISSLQPGIAEENSVPKIGDGIVMLGSRLLLIGKIKDLLFGWANKSPSEVEKPVIGMFSVRQPGWCPQHWEISVNGYRWGLTASGIGLPYKVICSPEKIDSYNWAQQYQQDKTRGGKAEKTREQVQQLVDQINAMKRNYNLANENCQTLAYAIGNYALGEWSYQNCLKWIVNHSTPVPIEGKEQ